jgi:orotate phosphoribosyltransferase
MNDVLDLFRQTGALLEGHFVLRSGLHSRQFFQCALLLRHTTIAAQVCAQLAEKLRAVAADEVISPAMGGLFVGHEVGRTLGLPHIFVEKEAGRLVLRRGFQIPVGRRFIVVEDVVARAGDHRYRSPAWRRRRRGGRPRRSKRRTHPGFRLSIHQPRADERGNLRSG